MPNKDVILYLDGSAPPPVVVVTEADTAWTFRFTVMYQNAIYAPNVANVILAGHKPDGNAFAFLGSKSGNVFQVGCNVQMTAVPGDVLAALHLLGGGNTAIPFILRVRPGAAGTDPVASASALPAYTTILSKIGNFPPNLAQYVSDWLEENISGGETLAVDSTFSIEGAAAPAKLTGDRLKALEEATIETDTTLTVDGAAAESKTVGDLFRAAERSANNVVAKYTDADTIFTSPANSSMYIIAERYPAGYIDHIDIYNADTESPFTLIEMFDSNAVCIGKFNAQITGAGWQSIPIKTFFGEEIYIGVSKTGLGYTRSSEHPKSYYTITFNTAYNNIDLGSVAGWTAHDSEFIEIGVKAVYKMTAPYSKGSVNNKLDSIDFNDLVDGYYFVDATENDNNPCINAPLSLTRGYFVVMCFPITDGYYMQFCQTTSNSGTDYDWSVHGLWFRYFSTSGAVEGRWQEVSPRDIINNKFIACGDSITAGFLRTVDDVNTYTTYKWPKEVARSLGLVLSAEATSGAGYLYERSGRSGIIVADNTDWTLYDLVTFAYGTNDWGNNMELGSISDTYPDNNTVYAAIKHCVETIITANPAICLILITPIQRFRSGQTVENDYSYGSLNAADTPYTLSDVCQAIVDVAKMYHLPYIDNRDGCVINTLNVRARTVDGLHPTDRGYIMLGQYYAAKIGAIFKPWVW